MEKPEIIYQSTGRCTVEPKDLNTSMLDHLPRANEHPPVKLSRGNKFRLMFGQSLLEETTPMTTNYLRVDPPLTSPGPAYHTVCGKPLDECQCVPAGVTVEQHGDVTITSTNMQPKLTQEQKRIKLAEFLYPQFPVLKDEHGRLRHHYGHGNSGPVENYEGDLDDLHEVEKRLTHEQVTKYVTSLRGMKYPDAWIGCMGTHATASQRFEALGKVLELW
jgi:hypothetical protein